MSRCVSVSRKLSWWSGTRPSIRSSIRSSIWSAVRSPLARSRGAGFAAVGALSLVVVASPAAASPIFATYSESNTGSVNGVGFTMTGLSTPGFGNDIQPLGDMVGSDWNNVGSQQGRIYNATTASTFTVTFDSAVSGLQMYLYFFRGATGGGGGFTSYDFGQAFTISGGLGSPITQSGTTLDTSTTNFANGVITFTGPVTTLTVTTTGSATGGDQGFTFAAVPVPGAGGVAGVLLAMSVARRRRRR